MTKMKVGIDLVNGRKYVVLWRTTGNRNYNSEEEINDNVYINDIVTGDYVEDTTEIGRN